MRSFVIMMCVMATLALAGCEKESDADTPNTTTPSTPEERITDLEKHRERNDQRWEAQRQYDDEEPDRILKAIEARLDRASSPSVAQVAGRQAAPPPITHLNNNPLVNSGCNLERIFWNGKWYNCQLASGSSSAPVSPPAAPAAEPVVPPGVYQVPLEPNLADYVRQRFPVSEQNQQAILAKQDETKELIVSGFKRIEGALTGLNDRVTALENARHPTPAPQSEPKVRADK